MTAPVFRSLDQLTGGERAISPVGKILDTADEIADQATQLTFARADADDAAETIGLLLHENALLRCRLEELEAALADAVFWRDHYHRAADALAAERDTWRARAQCGTPL